MSVLLCVLVLAATGARDGGPSAPSHELPPSVVFGRVAPASVVVEVEHDKDKAQGSGVVVGRERVVTNHHVVATGARIVVRQGERRWEATVAARDPKRDLVLLNVPGLARRPVPMRPSATLTVGERVYAVGAPRGLELTFSEGLISGLTDAKGGRVIRTTAAISPGSSGGGLFDAQARLVGITTFTSAGDQNLNFAHPTEWIAELEKGKADLGLVRLHHSAQSRPEALECSLSTFSQWGLFTSGAEMLESRSMEAAWTVLNFDTQLALLTDAAAPSSVLELVLSDIDKRRQVVTFDPSPSSRQEHYYFLLDGQDGVSVVFARASSFKGQPRVEAVAGECQALTRIEVCVRRGCREALCRERPECATTTRHADGSLPALCDKGDGRACLKVARTHHAQLKNEAEAVVHYRKACEAKVAEGCHEAGLLWQAAGNPQRAKEFFQQGCAAGFKQSCEWR